MADTAGMAREQSVTAPEDTPATAPAGTRNATGTRARVARWWPVALLRAAHPGQALLTAAGLGVAAALSGRAGREVVLVAATVLVGQALLGWHNDLVDRARDARHQTPRKPLADGRLEPGSVWFALTVALLLVVPLSVSTGLTAGIAYLLSLVVGLLGNVLLREGLFSWVPWAVSFALYPAYLSYGGWGGSAEGQPPEVWMTVLAGLLGIGVHLLRAIWGLVADDLDAWRYLPLRLGRRLGASRLLALAVVYCGAVVAAMIVVGTSVGLRR